MEFDSTKHPISWFRDRYREGTLKINPPYQRKPVWQARQKCYLIESILLTLPIPEIYLQVTTSPEGDSLYAIVDGQQRIRSVLQYIGSEEDPEEQVFNKFTLDKLEPTSLWHNQSFADLEDNAKKSFYKYKFTVRYLETDNDPEIRDLFKRLNKYQTPLFAQELRNATFSGPFLHLVEKRAEDNYWADNRMFTPASIRRMGDLEYISQLLIGVIHGPQGGGSAIVDSYYEQYEDYDDEFPDQERVTLLFEKTLNTIKKLLPEIKKSRWGNRTDFYTLFVALASLLRSTELPENRVPKLRKNLLELAEQIDIRLADGEAKALQRVIKYVRNVEKGANDKARRGARHKIMVSMMKQYFE